MKDDELHFNAETGKWELWIQGNIEYFLLGEFDTEQEALRIMWDLEERWHDD